MSDYEPQTAKIKDTQLNNIMQSLIELKAQSASIKRGLEDVNHKLFGMDISAKEPETEKVSINGKFNIIEESLAEINGINNVTDKIIQELLSRI